MNYEVRFNAGFTITYRPVHDLYAVQMRPIQWVLYHEHWWHGRIYIERGGRSESLTKKERSTIRFDGEPCIELDFSATHARLAYHLRGLECPGDPYHLWGDRTTKAQRELAKQVINTALNARSRSDAIGACFEAIRMKTKDGGWKTGNKRVRVKELRKALCQTLGITTRALDFFKQARAYIAEVYDRAIEHHGPIAADFGADAGASFMRVESSIALDVLQYFALRRIPVLGVHDSFIVPETRGDTLRDVMVECYRAKLGFAPVVK